MAPVPLEGQQVPMMPIPAEGQRGGSISLAMLIDFIVQRTYHELTVLAELLPRKTDMERKIEIYNFSSRTRQLFVRLLALVKWANSASKVDKSAHIMAFLDKQSMLFVDTADMLARMARETLVHARLPNFHIPAAVEVLTTGSYSRLPVCIREKIVPPDPITIVEKKTTLQRLNQVIQHRLVTGNLLPQMRNLKIDAGRVTFHVKHEFEVSLTVMGDGPNIPWRLLDVEILVEDKDIGEGKALVHPLQVQYVHKVLQARLADHPNPLDEVYSCLHFFAQSLQLEVLYSQALRLKRDRLENYIIVDEYAPGQHLTLGYWRELSSREPRSELGFKLTVQVDHHDSARPLAVVHSPTLGHNEAEIAEKAIYSAVLSVERLLVHTIYVRSKSRLSDLKTEIQGMLSGVDCTLSGVPAVLSVPLLQPCQRAEQMLVTVETYSGILQCCVPQYEAPMMQDLSNALNGDRSKLPTLLSELRYWVVQRRCEKTLMHLPVSVKERMPLMMPQDNSIASRLGRHHMLVQLHHHGGSVLIVDLHERKESVLNVDCTFYLATVRPASINDDDQTHSASASSADDNVPETETPKPYLKVLSLVEFDTFVATHGPWTNVEDPDAHGKRKLIGIHDSRQRSKHPAYFIPELAHVVAMCDERLPFLGIAQEFTRRAIPHQGIQVESGATGLMLQLVSLPPPEGVASKDSDYLTLLRRLLSITIRACTRNPGRAWVVELVFAGSPLQSLHPREQGNRRPVYLQYEMLPVDHIAKTVDALLSDWEHIYRIFSLAEELSKCFKVEKYCLPALCLVKSYNYLKLILCYGPDKGATVTVQWLKDKKAFSLCFGALGRAVLAHSITRQQLIMFLNQHKSAVLLIQLLQETYEPLSSVLHLSSSPQLGINSNRPMVPVQTWTIIAQTPTLLRLVYQSTYCLELRIKGNGYISIRDGAHSIFDSSNVVSDFMPTRFLKTFLSKYATETDVSRRRSQSEDENPPSPVLLEQETSNLLSGRGPQSPASQKDGLRFHPPLTPPSGSNPHTPASPLTANVQGNQMQTGFGSSPATSFSLASPPSIAGVTQSASPGVGLMSGSSPNPLPMASPLAMPSASPQPSMIGHSPAGSFMGGGHMDGSPFPASQSMASPAASNWPNSPGMPRPSPARPGHGDHKTADQWQQSRVLPQRFWAGTVPTVIMHKALDVLCRPCPMPPAVVGPNAMPPQVPNGTPDLCPLERFLGCTFMLRQMHRFVQSEETLTDLRASEHGVVHFKTESLQCRLVLNPNHQQTLHMKVASLPDNKDQWAVEEIQIIEKFFEMRVACPPFKPNSLLGLARMLNTPYYVLKDFIQLMKLDLMPSLAQQNNFKWSIQLCLRVPPSSASPIVPTGQAGVLISRSKILFFVQLTRITPNPGEGTTLVLPLVYDIAVRNTQVAEKRDPVPALAVSAANMLLKRFAEYSATTAMGHECTLLLAIRDLLSNLTLPSDVPQVGPPGGPGPMQGMMHPPMGTAAGPPMGAMGPGMAPGIAGPGPTMGPGMGPNMAAMGPAGMGPGPGPGMGPNMAAMGPAIGSPMGPGMGPNMAAMGPNAASMGPGMGPSMGPGMGGPPVGGAMGGGMGNVGGHMAGPMANPMGGPMGGGVGGPMTGPMGGPMAGPMGGPMGAQMGGPMGPGGQFGGPMGNMGQHPMMGP